LNKEKIFKAKYIVQDSKTVIKNGCLIINRNIIGGALPFDSLSEDQKHKIDDLGDVIIAPGLVNAHSHVALNSVKGLGYGKSSALYDVMWGIEPSLETEDVYRLSKLGILDALRSGTTSINDHYFFSEAVVKACEEVGIRGFIGHTVMTEYGPWQGAKEVSLAKELVRNSNSYSEIIHPVIAPHATDTVNPKTLIDLKEFADSNDVPIHIHLSQTQREFDYIKEKYGLSPIKHAKNIGLLDKTLIAAHCNVAEEGDLEILSEADVYPVFCPTTHGVEGKLLDTNSLTSMGADWGIGTDCPGGNDDFDMLEEMRMALVLNNSKGLDSAVTPKEVFNIATSENTKRMTKSRHKGTLEEGELADFIVVDIKNERMQPLFDVINNLVMSSTSSQVKSVFVNGEQIVENYLFTKVDEEKILSEGLEVIDKLFERSGFDKRIEDGDFL